MSYYSGRKPKPAISKPNIIHNESISSKDVEWISEEIMSTTQKNTSIKINQEDISKKLSLHFEKSVGVSIVEGG